MKTLMKETKNQLKIEQNLRKGSENKLMDLELDLVNKEHLIRWISFRTSMRVTIMRQKSLFWSITQPQGQEVVKKDKALGWPGIQFY